MKKIGRSTAQALMLSLFLSVLGPAQAATELSFLGVPTVTDGNGIDTGSVGTTARWSNIGTLNGTVIDLEIEVISNNRTGDSMSFVTDTDDAAVFLDGATDQIVELDYNFYVSTTNTPITIIPEGLIQDLDSNGAGTLTLEIVRVMSSQVASYTVEAGGTGSDLTVTPDDNGTPGDTSDDMFVITSAASGNPGDSNISIELDFQPASTIRLQFETANGGTSRRFSFDGNADNFFTTPDESPQDVTPPAIPTVALLSTNDATPTLTGTAEAFSSVTIVVGGATFERVALSDGTWSLDTGTVAPESGTFSPNITGSAANEVVVTSTDAAGNGTSDASGNELVIDATAPVVAISSSDVVNLSNESNYSVNGTCTDGDGAVNVSIAGAVPASFTPVCSGGSWSVSGFDVSAIVDGANAIAINASQTDSFGNVGNATTVEVDKDTVAPVVPTVIAQVTNDTTPVITGTAGANAPVAISVAGALYSTTANGSGLWSIDTQVDVPDSGTFNPNTSGANNVGVTSTDSAGNSSTDVTSGELVIDTGSPSVAITTADVVNSDNANNYAVGGSCTAGDGDITVSIAGATPPTQTTPCSGGSWSVSGFDVAAILDGSNAVTINASQTDAAGNTGNATAVQVDKDTLPPGVPTVDSQTTNDVTPVITGTADAGATVTVVVAGATYTAVANGAGAWSIDTATAAPTSGTFSPDTNGVNEVNATVADSAGNSSSDATVGELTIDTTDPVVPTVTTLLSNDPTPIIGGTAEANSSNTVVFAGATYTVIANGSGVWTLDTGVVAPSSGTFNPNLNGVNEVSIETVDGAGNTRSDVTSNEVTIDTTESAVTIAAAATANAGNSAGYTVGGVCTTGDGDVTVTIVGATPPSQTVACSGNVWSAVFDVSAISDGVGAVQIGASQTDAAGNVGSADISVDKDTVVPIVAITDNGSGGDDVINNAESMAVVISGTAETEDGQLVTVRFDDGTNPPVVTTATVSGGVWTAGPVDIMGLDNGPLTITADVSDAAGNAATTASVAVTQDNGLPDLVVDTIGTTNNSRPPFSGTTDQAAGSSVIVRDELGATVCTAAVIAGSPANTWSCTPTVSISEGSYTYSAEVDDGSGNLRVVNFDFTIDLDTDDDGIPDAVEGIEDTDGDGTPDFMDTDSDNDGIPDSDEDTGLPALSGNDTDGDGIDDALDVDQTGGTDADGDGIDDALAPTDTDGDGTPDYRDSDSDGDGIPDADEGNVDSDGDGVPDYQDTDSDNDGIPDALENDQSTTLVDTDADGVPDFRDPDSDNDGLPDAVEAANVPPLTGIDSDSDGIDDAFDVDVTGGDDRNGDGVDDATAALDTDGDGLSDYLDPDSDNDGISDLEEGRSSGTDADSDGIDDTFDVDQTGGTDANNDGLDDGVLAADFDADGVANYLDLDSDNDGRTDVIEAGFTDANGDALVDDGSITNQPPNTDGVDGPDYIDLDSNNDGSNDIVGTDAESADADNDGQIDPDNATDNDGDGVADIVDDDPTMHGTNADTDLDGIRDSDDLDDDNDGIPDVRETDNGVDVDTDGDGIPDRIDLDSDNDGISDSVEAIGNNSLDMNRDGVLDDVTDTNGDGLADQVPSNGVPLDTDGDGVGDFRDLDSDDDGTSDLGEGGRDVVTTVDTNGDGVVDGTVDADGDGLIDIVDPDVTGGDDGTAIVPVDTDGDGAGDQIDTDSDNDGISDAEEPGDINGDGIDDSIQNTGQLDTAVRGAGSADVMLLIVLMALMLARFMRHRRALAPLCLAVFVLAAGVDTAHADEYGTQDGDWYATVGLGVSMLDPEGNANGWSTSDEGSDGFKVRLGYRFQPRWFGELSYIDAGEAGIGNANVAVTDIAKIEYEIPAVFVGYLLREPGQRWNALVKLGISSIDNASNDARVQFDEQSSAQLALGLAAAWNITEQWFVTVEHDMYDRDARFTSINIGLWFGEQR